jgi:hypothetical protein
MDELDYILREIGVGYNTPGIIRYPFESMLLSNPNAILIKVNRFDPAGIEENRDSSVALTEEITKVVNDLF